MRVLVAPDKFKGTLTATEVALAISKAVRAFFRDAEVHLRPVADGGEGTMDALLNAIGGRIIEIDTRGPTGGDLVAPIAVLNDGRACIEMSLVVGFGTIHGPADALTNSTYGLGDALSHAVAEDHREILVGIGGSITTDGGTGAARAIGWRFLDAEGNDLRLGGGSLVDLAAIRRPGGGLPPRGRVVGICDVSNKLLGPDGAARAFAPQKGASDADVERLEEGMEILALRIKEDLGIDVSELEGGGAGGGMGAGLVAFFGASLRPGFAAIAEVMDLGSEVAEADLVITGEGRLDGQSLGGKAPIGVAEMAKSAQTRCLAVAGEIAVTKSTLSKYGVSASLSVKHTGLHERADLSSSEIVTRTTETLLRRVFERANTGRFARGPLGNRLTH